MSRTHRPPLPTPPTSHHARVAGRGRHPLVLALAAVAFLHVLGFGLLLVVVAPRDLTLSTGEAFGIGAGLTAYTLGMRHAFDADHIAAIDNTTRKLLHDGKQPHASGFFFSAGHSTVVFLLAALVAIGVSGLGSAVGDETSTLHQVTSVWGPSVAGTFLLAVGLVNLAVVRRSVELARRARRGDIDPAELDLQLTGMGLLSRTTQRLARRITSAWQLYPLGFMFGLGFDTATEIALLVLAGGGAASGLPVLAILSLPILFAAGMTLLDTLNGAAVTKAYGWALVAPGRRLAYNALVTGVSVAFALVIGTLSLLGVAVAELDITTGPVAALAEIDVANFGFALLITILLAWAAAAIWWRSGQRNLSPEGR